jgi:hypothetical protein
MLRLLYKCVLRLHPPGFRKRFAAEMLSIFDHTAGKRAALLLFADGVLSLARQWTLRPEFWTEVPPAQAQQSVTEGIPSFHTLDAFRPRASAVIHGLVLSTALFCVTCFAIKYSWIHVLHVRIPEVEFANPHSIQSKSYGATDARSEKSVSPRPQPEDKTPIASVMPPPEAQVQPPPSSLPSQQSLAQTSAVSSSREAMRPEIPPSSTTIVPDVELQSYAGIYLSQSPSSLTISIGVEGDHLAMAISGQPKRQLIRVSEAKFVAQGTEDCWIEFAGAGNSTETARMRQELRLFQSGRQFTARRQ